MNDPLSPAAQMVLKTSASSACLQHWGAVNDPPCHPSDDGWNGCGDCVHRSAIAAALRAVAEQKLPQTNEPNRCITTDPERDVVFIGAWHIWNTENRIRRELLAIATELEAQ